MKNTKRNAPGSTHSKQTKPETKGNAKRPEIRDDMDSRSTKEVGYREKDNKDKERQPETKTGRKPNRREMSDNEDE